MKPIETIISSLRAAMTDARQNESNFESWMILNEAICDAIDALAEQASKAKEQAKTDAYIKQLDESLAEQPACKHEWLRGECLKCGQSIEQPAQQHKLADYEPDGMRHNKPLTDDQIMEMYNEPRSDAEMLEFARAIEAAHGIGEQK